MNNDLHDYATPHLTAGRIYSDGACSPNPGVGGWAAIIVPFEGGDAARSEISGGFRKTTNNRMEIFSALMGFEHFARLAGPKGHRVVLVTDSEYVANALRKGWLVGWEQKGYVRNARHGGREPVPNSDLWRKMHLWTQRLDISVEVVRGHAGHTLNEECDRLAVQARKQANLPPDDGYEALSRPVQSQQQRFLF